MRRKRKAFEKKPLAPHEEAERVIEASSQPVSTEAPAQLPDRTAKGIDEAAPEKGELEQTMKDYYAQTDAEAQCYSEGTSRSRPDTAATPGEAEASATPQYVIV